MELYYSPTTKMGMGQTATRGPQVVALVFITSLAEWMAHKKFKLYIYNTNGLPKKFKVHELRK